MLHAIAKFRPSRLGIAFRGHPLKHSFLPKVMNECPFFQWEMTANCCEIFPHRSVSDKLTHQCLSIRPGFSKQQNPRRGAIDAMYDKNPLPL